MVKKRWWQTATAAFIIGAGFIFFFTSSDSPENVEASEGEIQEGTIIVRGEGNISVEPDLANIHVGAEATDTSADAAQEQVSEKMAAIREQLEAYDISKDNRETVQVGVNPYHEPSEDGEEQYRAQHILKVEYEDIDKVGELLDDLANAGANRIDNTQFTLKDETKAESEALQQAIEKTKDKATAMAKSAGKSSGNVLQIAEGNAQISAPTNNMTREESAADSGSGQGTTVEAGEVEVVKYVDVVYKLN